MSMDTEDTLLETYNAASDFAAAKIADGAHAHEVAAALVALGASIYKTTMAPEDFDTMMAAIYNQRHRVQRLVDTPSQTLN
jgi:hypothetical protein